MRLAWHRFKVVLCVLIFGPPIAFIGIAALSAEAASTFFDGMKDFFKEVRADWHNGPSDGSDKGG